MLCGYRKISPDVKLADTARICNSHENGRPWKAILRKNITHGLDRPWESELVNDDIQFGDIEQTQLRSCGRPDRDPRYAVAVYGTARQREIPIFVDLDVMRSLEWHAASDTSVELGGVVLGGQYADENGKPFVAVTELIRAQHYENTRGSFKFTHDTWAQIARDREALSQQLDVVGWYHTHPSWGVFLSGLDTFICEHFFNKPLDVALVIDPCNGERNFFQWSADPSQGPQPSAGFRLYTPRPRSAELEHFVLQLESESPMAETHRPAALAGALVPRAGVNADPTARWFGLAVLGMLTMQFCLLAIIAWRVFAAASTANPTAASAPQQIAAERQVLGDLIDRIDVAPDGLLEEYESVRRKNSALEAANVGLAARVESLRQETTNANARQASLQRHVEQLQATVDQLRNEAGTQEAEADAPAVTAWRERLWSWRWYGAVLLLVVGGIVTIILSHQRTPLSDAQTAPDQDGDQRPDVGSGP